MVACVEATTFNTEMIVTVYGVCAGVLSWPLSSNAGDVFVLDRLSDGVMDASVDFIGGYFLRNLYSYLIFILHKLCKYCRLYGLAGLVFSLLLLVIQNRSLGSSPYAGCVMSIYSFYHIEKPH